MDAVAPAIIGIGIYLMYEAWKSHQTGNPPTPIAKIKGALGDESGSTTAVAGASEPAASGVTPAGTNPPVSTSGGAGATTGFLHGN